MPAFPQDPRYVSTLRPIPLNIVFPFSSYKKTEIIDLQGNVIISSQNGKKLETSQLYFDQKNEWFFTEKHFKYSDEAGGYLEGPGVDFSKDFKIFNMQQSSGEVNTTDK